MSESLGVRARLAMDTSSFDANSEPYEIVSETLQKKTTILDTNGLAATRQHPAERTRFGLDDVSGSITFNKVTPNMLDILLPRILGLAEVANVFGFAETISAFNVLVDRDGEIYLYTGCKVNKATFRATSGGFLELVLDLIGKTETTGQAFTDLTLGILAADKPYVMSDGVLTLQAGGREFSSFELVIDNALVAAFRNSTTATDIDATDHLVTLKVAVPNITGNQTLYEQAIAGATGTLVFTQGSLSTTFTFATLQAEDRTPSWSGRGPIPLNLEMTARKLSSTNALVVTNVPV